MIPTVAECVLMLVSEFQHLGRVCTTVSKTFFSRQFRVEAQKLLERTRRDCAGAVAIAAQSGMLLSSRTALQLEKVTMGAEAVLTDVAFRLTARSFSAAGVSISPDNAEVTKLEIRNAVLSQETAIREIMYSMPPFRGDRPMLNVDDSKNRLDQARQLEFDRVETEIDLIAMRNETAKNNRANGDGSIVFNGPVAQVIAGTGNSGTVNQVIDASSAQELTKALDDVLRALSLGVTDETENALIEVVHEAKSEIEKEEPNRIKVGALISGVNQTLAAIPKARDAYVVLKSVAESIGLI